MEAKAGGLLFDLCVIHSLSLRLSTFPSIHLSNSSFFVSLCVLLSLRVLRLISLYFNSSIRTSQMRSTRTLLTARVSAAFQRRIFDPLLHDDHTKYNIYRNFGFGGRSTGQITALACIFNTILSPVLPIQRRLLPSTSVYFICSNMLSWVHTYLYTWACTPSNE